MKNVKRPAFLLLATIVTVSALAGGVALAATVNCTANTACVGTSGEDRICGAADATGGEDMRGLGGGDVLRGYAGFDFLNGGAGADLPLGRS